MALFGPPDVEKLTRKRDVGRLVKLLDHESVDLRRQAATALGELIQPDDVEHAWVVEGLAASVQGDVDEGVRLQAVSALLRVYAARAQPLVGLLAREEFAAAALGPLLVLTKEQGEVGESARKSLMTPRSMNLLQEHLDPAAVDLLLAAVEERGELSRPAIEALARLGDSRAVEPLIALVEERGELARPAIDALARLGVDRAVDPLVAVLEEGGKLALGALQALENLGGARAVEALVGLLGATDPTMQAQAARALGATKDPGALEPLLAAFRDDSSSERQEAAAYGLGTLGDPRAVEALAAAVEDESPAAEGLQSAALWALRQIGNPAAEKALQEYERSRMDPKERRALERHEQEERRRVEAITRKVERYGDTQMVAVLRELCVAYVRDDDRGIRRLEPLATAIGERLDRRGGIQEMRRVFYLLGGIPGSRTLEMHWGGIGEWQG